MVLVSVIMPCFNSEKFISESIKSVLMQTYADWELLICDDGSEDNSKAIIKSFQDIDSRIKLVTNGHSKGAPGARNSCLDVAKGRYVAFLDSDDTWLPKKLAKQISFMEDNQVSFVFSYYENMSEKSITTSICKSPNSVDFRKMLFCNFIGCLTAIYDTKIIGKCYQPEIKKRNDYALWLTILSKKDGMRAYCVPEVTGRYRVNGYGLSSNKISALKYYQICLREYSSISELSIHMYSFYYLAIMLLKKKFPKIYNVLVCKI